ncbi:hypothetical protein ACEXAJ_09745 [Fusobacterium necrophorum subsp. funduliforme]|nr:hypothetical protein [Fusobacterium necrophorum]
MNSELYVKKAILQLSRKKEKEAVESLNKAIDLADDIVSVTQAYCILGEYYFIHRNYQEAFSYFSWILDRAEDLEEEFDDLLSEEINRADVLLELMERYSLHG